MKKTDIKSLSLSEIKDFLAENKQQAFRAKQVHEWLWKKTVYSFDEMTNLSLALRELLNEHFSLAPLKTAILKKSKDKTIKIGFELIDGHIIEGVLIPAKTRATACISTQVGCTMGCKFCATGQMTFERNLTASEIFDQVVELNKQSLENFNTKLTNIVIMGMGEPLLNYNNVLEAINNITSPNGLGMSPSRITLSTVGLPRMIKKLADDKVKFDLAISLHSADEGIRTSIVPANEENSLELLTEAISYFYEKTKNRVTFEYLLLKDVNDDLSDAKKLAVFCRSFPCKINLIEYNATEGDQFQKSSKEKVDAFVEFIESKNMLVQVRRSRGQDIDAACGQLANKNK